MALITRDTVAYGENFGGGGATTITTSAFNLGTGKGVLVLIGAVHGGATLNTVTDTAGNTYNSAGSVTDSTGYRQYAYTCDNSTANASNVVTATWSANVTFRGIIAIQYSGLDTAGILDVFSTATSGSTHPSGRLVTSSNFTTAINDEAMVVMPRWGFNISYTVDPYGPPTHLVTAELSGNLKWGERILSGVRPSAPYSFITNAGSTFDLIAIITLKSSDTATEAIRLTQEVLEVVEGGSEDLLLSQEVIELVDDASAGNIQLSQDVIELVLDTFNLTIEGAHVGPGQIFAGTVSGPFRVTQVLAETSEAPGTPDVLFSQVVAEVGQDPNEVRVSQVVAEAAQDPNELRVSQVVAETSQDPNEIRVSQIIAEIAQDNVPTPTSGDTRVTQLFLSILGNRNEFTFETLGPCEGDGIVPTGINPAAGVDLRNATTPLVWVEFSVAGGPTTPVYAAKVAINTGTRKPPRMLNSGHTTRGLSDFQGRMETASAQITLNDTDRFVRNLIDTGSIFAQDAAIYLADRITIESLGTPRRLLMGNIKDYSFPSDFQVELEIEDQLTFDSSPLAGNTLIPKQLIPSDITDFTASAVEREQLVSWPCPLAYGSLTDEDSETPLGVVMARFVEQSSIYAAYGLSNMDIHLVCLGAVADFQSAYCADYLTGGDNPTARMRVPDEAWGDWIFAPHMPGWPTGDMWFESPSGRRYTVIMSRQEHPASIQAREGRIPFTCNICGYEEIGDGTGEMIASLPRQWVHFLTNFVFADYDGTGNWATSIPMLGGSAYSAIDTESVEAVKVILDARAGQVHAGAFLLGHHETQVNLEDVLAAFNRNMGADSYINKHGQLALTTLDTDSTYASAKTLGQTRDIAKGIKFDPRPEEVENYIEYGHSLRYHRLLAETTADENLRVREPKDTKFISGILFVQDTVAQGLMGGRVRKSRHQDYDMLRVAELAEAVASYRLAWLARPRFQAELPLVDYYGADMELGDVVSVTHEQGITVSGWTNRRCQIRRLTIDTDKESSSLTIRDVEDLLP